MNKSDLIEALRKETDLPKREATDVIELFFDAMTKALAKGEIVEIRDLFSMFVKEYKASIGRNPKHQRGCPGTGQRVTVFQVWQRVKGKVYFPIGNRHGKSTRQVNKTRIEFLIQIDSRDHFKSR